ncbi:DNAJ heat shock N-terminal domain-containing family protein [Salix suchowensis]|nr:DNAJ heat shock N-terminal domain-containing family protein [Salix suchowensis]
MGRFMKMQKAWEILGNSMSRALYDSKLRALRQDSEVSEDISLEEMMVEDNGEIFEMFYQCRCGDYFSIDSSEFEKMGYTLSRDECWISIETPDAFPASVVLPCGSCSLQVRLLINADAKGPLNNTKVESLPLSGGGSRGYKRKLAWKGTRGMQVCRPE